MQTYHIKLTASPGSPLLMHADDVEWSDRMEAWRRQAKTNREASKAGDDRSPAWTWIGSLYHDGQRLVMPLANIMRALAEAGAMISVPGSRKSFKDRTQSGIMPLAVGWPLLVKGKEIPFSVIADLAEERDFGKHQQAVAKHGFSLLVKRARIGQAKHIRVRPMFEGWSAAGALRVMDDTITPEILQQILSSAGQLKGLGDWRPGGRTPGTFGMFTAETVAI
jgi:hypothetical protein